jgi:hypothetical protein
MDQIKAEGRMPKAECRRPKWPKAERRTPNAEGRMPKAECRRPNAEGVLV